MQNQLMFTKYKDKTRTFSLSLNPEVYDLKYNKKINKVQVVNHISEQNKNNRQSGFRSELFSELFKENEIIR